MAENEATAERLSLPPCQILIKGKFAPDQISVTAFREPTIFSPGDTAFIEENWKTQLAKNPNLFNGLLVSLNNFELNNGQMKIEVSPTDFKTHIGARLLHLQGKPQITKGLGTAFGMCGVLLSADNQIILAQRKVGTLQPGNMVSMPVGFIDPKDTRDGIIDPFITFGRELKEEAGLTTDELSEYYCAGLVRENYTGASAVVFLAKSKLAAKEIIKGAVNEEVRLIALPNDPKELAKFIADNTLIDTIHSIGALELALDEMDNSPDWSGWIQKRTEKRNTFYEENLTPEQKSELANKKRRRLMLES